MFATLWSAILQFVSFWVILFTEALSFVPGNSFEAEPIDLDWARVRSRLK